MLSQQNKYLETKIQTATQEQLLIMLCEGAIKFCRLAIESIEKRNIPEANDYLLRAQEIITEFTVTIDKKSAIAEPLLQLYEYFLYRLREANIKKDKAPLEEVIQFLQELKETWVEAALSIKKQSKPSNAATYG